MNGNSSARTQSGVQIELSFFPLAFFLFFCTPRVSIDGMVQERPWGTYFFPLAPGVHRIKIYFGYLMMPECGANTIDVMVADGNTTCLKYYMPPAMFLPGSMEIVGYAQAPRF